MQDLKAEALELAGFTAAHAAWIISAGQTLIPIGGNLLPDGSKGMCTFFDEDLGGAVAMSKEWLETNPTRASCAVTAIDGFVTFAERLDAIVLEVRSYVEPVFSMNIYVPYRPAKPARLLGLLGRNQTLIIYRPKFANLTGFAEGDHEMLGEAFFGGIDSHEKGQAVWDASYDDSK